MDNEYFNSITQEIYALKNRVRHFIKDKHWLSDGLWKESVLRSVIRRHLPKSLAVGTGFVAKSGDVSSQIDILIYDTTKPILFQDGDFVIVTPDLVKAIIEVKTCVQKNTLAGVIEKLANHHQFAASTALCQPFVGLFSFEDGGIPPECLLEALDEKAQSSSRRIVHCVVLGPDQFTLYWECPPESSRTPNPLWRSYCLSKIAPAYFIHNLIGSLCENSVRDNGSLWFPKGGKEHGMLQQQTFTKIKSHGR